MGILTGLTAGTAGLIAAGAGSAASAGAGIASSIMSNNQNMKIAQMNNQFNEKMLDKQINYNRDAYATQLNDAWKFWNATNEYNSPEQQVSRLRAAGLNPQLAMNSSNVASVGSTPSMQGINTPTASQYSADYSAMAHGITSAVDQLFNLQKTSAETANINIEGKYKAAEIMTNLSKIRADTNNTELKTRIDAMLGGLQAEQTHVTNQRLRGQLIQDKIITRGLILDNLSKQVQFNALPQQIQLSMTHQAADIAFKLSQGELTRKQVEHEIHKIASTIIGNKNLSLQGQQLKLEIDKSSDTRDIEYNTAVAIMKKAINETVPDMGIISDNVAKPIFHISNRLQQWYNGRTSNNYDKSYR